MLATLQRRRENKFSLLYAVGMQHHRVHIAHFHYCNGAFSHAQFPNEMNTITIEWQWKWVVRFWFNPNCDSSEWEKNEEISDQYARHFIDVSWFEYSISITDVCWMALQLAQFFLRSAQSQEVLSPCAAYWNRNFFDNAVSATNIDAFSFSIE